MEKIAQKQRILQMLRNRPVVPLYEILDITPRIASYRRRISDLRADGHTIDNWKEWNNGVCCSFYRLRQ